ncbi:MAG: cellulose binding domain-containing protein [Bacteroidales bacterium]|nr:cellulose binding domain-containing protein [Clostridium sp.]MCM1204468.1 cellulose binding domain-containing protein [Bacteroidales bacterium]
MSNKGKLFLIFAMLILIPIFNNKILVLAKDLSGDKVYIEQNNYYSIYYKVHDEWSEGYNIEIYVENASDETIYNWKMQLIAENKIDNIWNAQILKENNDTYILMNDTSNKNINAGEYISFGLVLRKNGKSNECFNGAKLLYMQEDIQQENIKIDTEIKSSWNNNEIYEITIENLSNHNISNWNIEFLSNGIIKNIWNAKIKSNLDNRTIVVCEDYNSIIKVNEKVTFGLELEYADIYNKQMPTQLMLTVSENDFLKGIQFIGKEAPKEMDTYAHNIINVHLQMFEQDKEIEIDNQFRISDGIQVISLQDTDVLGTETYCYWIYDDKNIIGYLRVYDDEGEYQSIMSLCDLKEMDFKSEKDQFAFAYVNNNLCLIENNKVVKVLESAIEENLDDEVEEKEVNLGENSLINTLDRSEIIIYEKKAGARAITTSGKTLAVPIVVQGGDPICWAACMASICNYKMGMRYTANDVIKKTKHGNKGATTEKIVSYFKNVYKLQCTQEKALTYAKVKSYIQGNQPIYAIFRGKKIPENVYTKHAVIIKGYYQQNKAVVYYIMNPQSSQSQSITVSRKAQNDGTKLRAPLGSCNMGWKTTISYFRK